jgi:hypothetical protein
MADDDKMAQLAKKIEDQSRFTRTVVVICTAAIMGVMFYSLTEIYAHVGTLVVTNAMANMDAIHQEWQMLDKKAAATAEKPAAAPAK